MKKINLNIFLRKENRIKNSNAMANAPRDWKIVIGFFGVCLVGLSAFAWSIYLSNQIGGGFLSSKIEDSSTSVKMVEKKDLKNSLEILRLKQLDFTESKKVSAKLVDPSL